MFERSAGVTFDTVLGEVLEGGSDHVEFIFLPLSDSSFHDEISVALPSDNVLPFLKCSGRLDMVESSKSSGKDCTSLLLVSIVEALVRSDFVLMLEGKLSKLGVKFLEMDLGDVLRVFKEVLYLDVALCLPGEEGSSFHPVIHLV